VLEEDAELRLATKTISPPSRTVGSVEEARSHWQEQPRQREGLARYEYWLAQHYQERSSYEFTLRAAALGSSVLLHMPGEPFAETAKAIRAAVPFEQVVVTCNPCPEAGYLPTAEAHREGGDEPLFAALGTEAEEQIRAAAIELLCSME